LRSITAIRAAACRLVHLRGVGLPSDATRGTGTEARRGGRVRAEGESRTKASRGAEGGERHQRNRRKATGLCLAGGPPCSPPEEEDVPVPRLETMGRWRR
jgi:hypothetical protein